MPASGCEADIVDVRHSHRSDVDVVQQAVRSRKWSEKTAANRDGLMGGSRCEPYTAKKWAALQGGSRRRKLRSCELAKTRFLAIVTFSELWNSKLEQFH